MVCVTVGEEIYIPSNSRDLFPLKFVPTTFLLRRSEPEFVQLIHYQPKSSIWQTYSANK
jgi:hypothetical protein